MAASRDLARAVRYVVRGGVVPGEISSRRHKVIGASQIAGGVVAGGFALYAAAQGVVLDAVAGLLLEGLAVAGLAAGIWLWQGRPEGLRLTCVLLALQVPKVYGPKLAYDLAAGLGIIVYGGSGAVGVHFDLGGRLIYRASPGLPFQLAINVLALVWLCLLLGAAARASSVSKDAMRTPEMRPAA